MAIWVSKCDTKQKCVILNLNFLSVWSYFLHTLCARVRGLKKPGNKFIIDVSSPILTLINHFESDEPKIFVRFDVIGDFMVTFMANVMRKGANLTTNYLLNVDVMDKELQLSDANIYLGPKVKAFFEELGITRNSPEVAPWVEKVRAFYCEALAGQGPEVFHGSSNIQGVASL